MPVSDVVAFKGASDSGVRMSNVEKFSDKEQGEAVVRESMGGQESDLTVLVEQEGNVTMGHVIIQPAARMQALKGASTHWGLAGRTDLLGFIAT